MDIPDCGYCGQKVDPSPGSGHYKKVEGWVRLRSGGGANEVALRRDLDEYMHKACMDLRRNGIHPNQERMFR